MAGNIARLGQNPLVAITVTGHARRPVARAANDLARTVVFSNALASYSKTKIANLQLQVDQEQAALKTLNTNLKAQQAALGNGSGLSTSERLIALGQLNGLQQQLLTTTDQLTTNQQQLALAKDVEAPQITTLAAATKTTARSRRNTVLVAGLIGLILGIVAHWSSSPPRGPSAPARSLFQPTRPDAPGAAHAASSVAPVPSRYERSLRPCRFSRTPPWNRVTLTSSAKSGCRSSSPHTTRRS